MDEADVFSREVIRSIQDAIANSGLSNAEVIKRAHISQDYFYTRTRGEKPFNTNDISRIAEVLGLDALQLLREAGRRAEKRGKPEEQNTVDPLLLSDEEKVQLVLKKIAADDQTLAASTDPYKKYEKEGGDGR